MNKVTLGLIAGTLFAIVEVLILSSVSVPDKIIVMIASVLTHFSVGLLVATADLPLPGWFKGVVLGLLLTLPGALSNQSYTVMILSIGLIEGVLTGIASQKFAHH